MKGHDLPHREFGVSQEVRSRMDAHESMSGGARYSVQPRVESWRIGSRPDEWSNT